MAKNTSKLTWTVEVSGLNGTVSYVFDNEGLAQWFMACRTIGKMTLGSTPRDDGNFFMTESERDEALKQEPGLKKFIRQVYGSEEFINNKKRYCLWLVDASPAEIRKSKILYERVQRVKEFRLSSPRAATAKLAKTPHLFAEIRQPKTNYLLVPSVSSEKRKYIPMGYVEPDVIVTNAALSLPNATPYHFAVLTSSVHMAWMRRVTGRLKMDYRYSNTLVYNTFIWPKSTPRQALDIGTCGEEILEARKEFADTSLADLYDEVTMPARLHEE